MYDDESHDCWSPCCDLGPHACICGNDCRPDEPVTTSEHADLIARLRQGHPLITGDPFEKAVQEAIAALASTPSPAQPTECEHGIALADLCAAAESCANAPSPVQGADDRLAAINAEVQELTRQGYPTGILVRLLATYQQSPPAALNEVRAEESERAANLVGDWLDDPLFTESRLRARAAELRAAPQAEPTNTTGAADGS